MNGNEVTALAKSEGANKAKDPRKHHYVPVFYQTNFTNKAGLLWVYDRQLTTYKELHPRAICFEKDLYAVKPHNKPRDMQVETKVLRVVDSFGSRGIRDFKIGKPNSEAEQEVAFFMAFQWNRVPTISRDIRVTYAKAIEELSRIAFANVERAKALMERHTRETGEALNVTPESMVESVQGKHFEIVATETAFLTTMMEQAQGLTKVILRLDWEVLVASEETGFIICDCPVVVVPPKGSDQVGFVVPGSAKYFPLSRNLCLRLGEPGRRRRLRKVDKEAVRIINQNIAANSERFVIGPSRVQLENTVMRSGSARMESTPRFTLETVESDEDSALQKISAQPRRYFYPRNGAVHAP
jgi:Protein of unknown function (DUF4238)